MTADIPAGSDRLPPVSRGIGFPESVLQRRIQPLSEFFSPRTVAVLGANENADGIGRAVLWNLVSNPFGGTVFPVNTRHASVFGIKAYPSIGKVPEKVDLAVITTPPKSVPELIKECVEAGVRGAIVLSSGFKEIGPDGLRIEEEILANARKGTMRVLGPNCLGVMNPLTGLNATYAAGMARPGNVAFISQSGALCSAVLDWSLREMVGFSCFISVGSMLDVGWGDLIDYLGDDQRTQSILMYMESIGDARSFLSAAREVALSKPIIVIKAGRTEASARAAISHTGSLVESDDVLDAVFHRGGVLRVNIISDLFYMAEVLAKQPKPKGPHLAIITNAGGLGVLATDALIGGGGELASLSEESIRELDQHLPHHWSRSNPIDILGEASPDCYFNAVEIAAKDKNCDGVLVILAPQTNTDSTRTAEKLKPLARLDGKPILASWMGGASVAAGEAVLNRNNIPTFPYPDTAVRAFNYMWRYTYNLRGLYETPIPTRSLYDVRDRAAVEALIQAARESGRTLLTEYESKKILEAYAIPSVETRMAGGEDEAVVIAGEIGYPVVVKIASTAIAHKRQAGGVVLNCGDAAAVREACRKIESSVRKNTGCGHFQGVTVQPMIRSDGYDIIIGSCLDPQFGPVLLFGAGGRMLDFYNDRALALPPLNITLARRLMEQTRFYEALKNSTDIDLSALEKLLVMFSLLVVEQPWIKEIDIHPLLVSAEKILALDARIILHEAGVAAESLPQLAIRPYPSHYMSGWKMQDGTEVTIRPIRPEDELLMVRFHETLSERSVYLRYFHAIRLTQRVAHERLTRICFLDYDREMALVVLKKDIMSGGEEIIAVGRLFKVRGTGEGEFAILVSDKWHHRGLGNEMLKRLMDVGRAEKLKRIFGEILPENRNMLRVCDKLGFRRHYSAEEGVVIAEADI
ncbi:MAG TPA: bifunctional acetate--CoA ligase family protein/GNAT family N-acetyltransferase [Acidobacteriota bacterium]|nr:bifunctional acetate--CoA ligase family protein/GNAT family N-acetyltransferase [Acidobacteriota bacterium]